MATQPRPARRKVKAASPSKALRTPSRKAPAAAAAPVPSRKAPAAVAAVAPSRKAAAAAPAPSRKAVAVVAAPSRKAAVAAPAPSRKAVAALAAPDRKAVAAVAAPQRSSPSPGSSTALSVRELNRALLARQLLLERARMTPLAAIAQLVALQAQVARPPFVGLWTRLHGFQRDQLHQLLHDRHVVRATFLRGTLHLLTAADFRAFRPALQPMLTAGFRAIIKDRAGDLDLVKLAAFAGTRLPATFEQLRPQLAAAFSNHDERALGYAVRMHLPLVQVPTDDPWAFPSSAAFAAADGWLARSAGPEASSAAPGALAGLVSLVRRYLGGFGPATVKDAQRWSGVADLQPAFDALRPQLVTFRDDKRRELFDLPDAPRPPADTAAPVRFVPEFDNLVLGHDDRRRIVADEHRPALVTKNLQVKACFLVDGFVAGTWAIARARNTATLTLAPFTALSRPTRAALEAEADALLGFVEPDAATRAIAVAR